MAHCILETTVAVFQSYVMLCHIMSFLYINAIWYYDVMRCDVMYTGVYGISHTPISFRDVF
jgi:hypothetical protein